MNKKIVTLCSLIKWFKNKLKVKPFWNLYSKMSKLYVGEQILHKE